MRVQDYHVGTHLKVSRGLYTHHMLYIGSGEVIHYSGWANGPFDGGSAKVEIARLLDVARESPVTIVQHPRRKYSGRDAVARAMKRRGEREYNIAVNNCEHFVNWAIDGVHRSPQVEIVATVVDYALDGPLAPYLDDSLRGPIPLLRRPTVTEVVSRIAKAKEQSIQGRFGAFAGQAYRVSSFFGRVA